MVNDCKNNLSLFLQLDSGGLPFKRVLTAMSNIDCPDSNNRLRIGGATIDSLDLPSLLLRLDEMVMGGQQHYVCFCEAHSCVRATLEEDMQHIFERASLVLPDGVSMTLGARLLGKKLPARLTASLVMLEYCRHSVEKGLKHFFYGCAEGVPEKVADNLERQVSGLQIVGTYSPPYRPLTNKEEVDVKHRIEESGADILWVALGAPKQERWMADHVGKISVPVMLGVGVTFDYFSGNRKWAPVWIRKVGLEWAYRMLTSGRICRRGLISLPLFILIIMKQAIFTWLGFYRKPNQVG